MKTNLYQFNFYKKKGGIIPSSILEFASVSSVSAFIYFSESFNAFVNKIIFDFFIHINLLL